MTAALDLLLGLFEFLGPLGLAFLGGGLSLALAVAPVEVVARVERAAVFPRDRLGLQ